MADVTLSPTPPDTGKSHVSDFAPTQLPNHAMFYKNESTFYKQLLLVNIARASIPGPLATRRHQHCRENLEDFGGLLANLTFGGHGARTVEKRIWVLIITL